MNEKHIEDIITAIYDLVQDARAMPLAADKCIVEREKVLDMLDELISQFPNEMKLARTIVESRNEVITNAKREAESILKQAEQRARQMMSREEVYLMAENEANEMIKSAQAKIKELKQVTNEYVDDALRRTEDSIANALNEIKASRSSFMALTNPQPKQPSPIIEDI